MTGFFLGVQRYSAGELEPRASSAMWPFPCLHTPPCPFLHTEIRKDDHLSLFLSSPNLHIAK